MEAVHISFTVYWSTFAHMLTTSSEERAAHPAHGSLMLCVSCGGGAVLPLLWTLCSNILVYQTALGDEETVSLQIKGQALGVSEAQGYSSVKPSPMCSLYGVGHGNCHRKTLELCVRLLL